jgi:hypothetical protein
MKYAAILLMLALAGCIHRGPDLRATHQPRASEDEKSEATAATRACVLASANRLDDRTSDPQTIAIAVMAECDRYLSTERFVFTRGYPRREAYPMARGIAEAQTELTIRDILEERAAHRK